MPNPFCIHIPESGFHAHCKGRDALLAFQEVLQALRGRPFTVERGATVCRALKLPISGTFTYGGGRIRGPRELST